MNAFLKSYKESPHLRSTCKHCQALLPGFSGGLSPFPITADPVDHTNGYFYRGGKSAHARCPLLPGRYFIYLQEPSAMTPASRLPSRHLEILSWTSAQLPEEKPPPLVQRLNGHRISPCQRYQYFQSQSPS